MEINVILTESFEKWLKTLEYAESTVYSSVLYVNDFFFYLKSKGVTKLEGIQTGTLDNYNNYLQTRKNKRQGGGLSVNTITSNINALKRFSRYLDETGQGNLEVKLELPSEKHNPKTILNQTEIKALYKACGKDMLGIRDRAILNIYYACGLRRSEGLALNLKDVLLKGKRLYVRKGKNYKERYVPMTEVVKDDLENYIYVAREKIRSIKNTRPEALFLSMQVKRLCGNALIERVHKLAENAGIQKKIGMHSLRHSIATHLLESGMELEEVSRFLGHTSLESTQIYTHLSNE
jgi:integrase/recombinase XerD